MKKIVFLSWIGVFFLTAQLYGNAHGNNTLMPAPALVEYSGEQYLLDESFSVEVIGVQNGKVYPALTRMMHRLVGRTGLFLTTDFITKNSKPDNAKMTINIQRTGKLDLNEDESYSLHVASRHITLTATTDLGAMHGLETLLQLLNSNEQGYYFQGCSIKDAPRFKWRGLLIDVCRHFIPMEVLKRNIDGMASMKMNVLHLHLSEDQGFRVECKTFPKLHEMGSDGNYYTHEQIREILAYANARGIRVIPEFDLPGHCTSWLVGYPELASKPGTYNIERHWGVFDPSIDPTKESTYKFLDAFFKEMTQLFNDDYFHIGGDENTGKYWDENPEIRAFMKKNKIADNHALQDYFLNRVSKIFSKYNKKIVGWEEVMRQSSSTETIIQTWREDKVLQDAVQKGYNVIVSRGYYIDLMYSAGNHYSTDVIPKELSLTEKEKEQILGAEATMWAEFVTPENIDSRIWPRAAAIAERFWSLEKVNDVRDMYRRLDVVSYQLEELGLLHKKNSDFMLRRLTNNTDVTALRTFIEVVEPLKEYNRFDKGKDFTSYSSYSRVMDAATADARGARTWLWLVDDYASDTSKKYLLDDMMKKLLVWKTNHSEFVKTIRASPILKEMETLSEDLSTAAGIGIETITMIRSNKSVDARWKKERMDVIEKAKDQRGQCELMILDPMQKLVMMVPDQQ